MSSRSPAAFIASILVLLFATAAGARVSPSHPDRSNPATHPSAPRAAHRNEIHAGPTDVKNLTSGLFFATIADAINDGATATGDVIEVQVPSHLEGIVAVNKSVTIQGMLGGAVVHATTNTGNSGDARGWFLVTAAGVTFKNLTLDGESGAGIEIYQAIRFRADGGLVQNCTLRNIQAGAGTYDGRAIAMFDANVTVDGCSFSNVARIGVHIFGSAVTTASVTGCTYTGKGAGDWIDYGVEIGGGAKATVSENTITACTGVALSDGSISAGVLATDFFAPGTSGQLTNNFLTGNTYGVVAGFVDGSHPVDATVVTVNGNDLSGNATSAVTSVVAGTVDASGNWWGTNVVASVAAQTSGNPVDFTPWLDNGTDTNGARGFQGDFSTLHVDDDSPQSGVITIVQEGVNLVTASTVLIGPGTYVEQVNIGADTDLIGSGVSNTFIVSPDALTDSYPTPGPNNNFPIIFAHDAPNIRIESLTVDGAGKGNGNYRFVGIGYFNAGGRVSTVAIKRIEETPFSGTQHGVGLGSFNNTGGPYALEVANVTVTDFQKNGMTLAGPGLAVDVHDCSVTGHGYTPITAQNGIQISTGAAGSIARCAISNIGFSPQTFVASGVLVSGTGGAVAVSALNGANAITNVQAPISWYDGNGTMDGIQTVGGSDFGPIYVQNSSSSAPNAPRLAGARSRPPASMLNEGPVATARSSRVLASFTVSVENSCLDGTDATGTAGIGAYTFGGPLSVDARHNSISNWDVGLTTYSSSAVLTANENSVASNVSAGYDNTGGATPQNAENNWWGSASGPSGDGAGTGDAVLGGNVDFTPWLTSGTSLAAGCGFLPSTTIDLTSDVNPSSCGQKVNLIATVLPNTATGLVEFFDNGSSLGSAPIVGGVATFSTSSLTAGHHPLTASYAGDGNHSPSASNVYVQNVHCPPTGTTTVVVTPCDSAGWHRANVTGGGSVDISGTYPHVTGSLEFNTTGSPSKADLARFNTNADLLSTLSALAVDLYRNSSSTTTAHFAPAVRLFVYNGNGTDAFSYLIWEPAYNGVPTFPTNTWGTYDLFKGNFWQRAFKTVPPNKTIDLYGRTLSDWLQPGTVTDGDGDVSNVVGPNARVVAYEIGVGSGWSGTFAGAADDFRIGFGGVDSVYDFENTLPSAVTLSAPPTSTFGNKVVLTATVTPANATGTVEFADQAGTPAYFEGFETGLGGEQGWDHAGDPAGTATRVASGTNGVTSRTGGFHAEAGQYDLDVDGGSAYTRWGGYSAVFPPAGFTTTIEVYLDVAVAASAGDKRIDWISAISNSAGSHRRDFVFNLGTEPTGFVISAGNNAGRGGANPADAGHDPIHLTQTGWYTFKHRFVNDNGVLACRMTLLDALGNVIHNWVRSDPSDVIALIGGNRYGWFAAQELPFLAFDNATRTQASLGSAPVIAGTATLSVTGLAAGSHSFVATFTGGDCRSGSSSDKVAHEVDGATATLLALFQAEPVGGGVELRWRFASPVSDVAVERADRTEGPWSRIAAETRSDGEVTVALDRTATAAQTYFYRLIATDLSGTRSVFGPLSGRAGSGITEFALAPARPNPSRGPTTVEFALPQQSRIRLTVMDVQGRELVVLAEGVHRAGRYQASWNGLGNQGAVPVGLYFLRLQAEGKTFVQRLVLSR